MRSDQIHPGDLIAGKYRVRSILGRNHGLLVEAFHTEFDQTVIIKILPAGYGDDKEIERFRREARTLSKLESEHVARIIDVGSQDDGSFYLVRQYLEGTDLERYVRQSGPLPIRDAVLLILQAAEAIAETHGHGIIVRELQPSHLFLTQRAGGAPLIKVVDFGTAKLMREAAAPTAGGELTATAMFGLSPYSSPELVRKAKNVDVRTDVWSLGAILYELLTGRPPFSGEMAMLMLQIAKEEPVPATQYRPDLPAEIDQILAWAMAKDVDGRFRNVHAFAHSLAQYASAEGQVLIERIGQITQAAKARKKATTSMRPLPAPTPPPGRARSEDTVTEIKGSAYNTQPNPQASDFSSQPPSRGGGFGGGSTRSPASSRSGGMRTRGEGGRSEGGRSEGGTSRGEGGSRTEAGLLQPTAPVTRAAPPPPARSDRRLLYGILASLAVLVPVLVAVVVLTRKSSADGPVTADTGGPIQIPVAETAAPPAESAPPSATAPPPEPPASVAAPTPSESASAPPPATVAVAPAPTPRPQPAQTSRPQPQPQPQPQPPKTSKPPEPASGGGGTGTLVAVATGGNCAFSVNGASKGTSSSIKLTMPPGTYSITCRPSGGAAKSKSVTVKSGQTAFAAFKL